MPVDLLEAPVLVPEVTSLAIEAEFIPIERPAVLTLILVVQVLFRLAIVHHLLKIIALSGNFITTVSVLALYTISAEASFRPVLAHLPLVHGTLDEALPVVELLSDLLLWRRLLRRLLCGVTCGELVLRWCLHC